MLARIPDEWPQMSRNLSATAKALFVDALAYGQSRGIESDGVLAKVDLHRATYLPTGDLDAAVRELTRHGFWEDRGATWYMWADDTIRHLQYTREQREKKLRDTRERVARHRANRSSTSSLTDAPTQPNPTQYRTRDVTRDVTRYTPDDDDDGPPGSPPRDSTWLADWECGCEDPRHAVDEDGCVRCWSCGQVAS